jgi:MFS family permease
MRTWLLEGGLSALLFLALLPVAAAPLVGHVYRRFGYAARMPTALSLLTGLYACALLSFTTFPLPEDPEARCVETADIDYWQLQFGSSLGDVADALASRGASALTRAWSSRSSSTSSSSSRSGSSSRTGGGAAR